MSKDRRKEAFRGMVGFVCLLWAAGFIISLLVIGWQGEIQNWIGATYLFIFSVILLLIGAHNIKYWLK